MFRADDTPFALLPRSTSTFDFAYCERVKEAFDAYMQSCEVAARGFDPTTEEMGMEALGSDTLTRDATDPVGVSVYPLGLARLSRHVVKRVGQAIYLHAKL
jgi:hypothetical protein